MISGTVSPSTFAVLILMAQLEFCRLQNGQVGGFRAFEDFSRIDAQPGDVHR